MPKIISISLSPNVFPIDLVAARHMLGRLHEWREGEHLASLADAFSRYHGVSKDRVFSFNSGRSALLGALASLGIGEGDEVLLQSFTCNAVPNPVLWAGAMPIYVDVNEHTFTMDVADLERKITRRAKAIIIQHTFGLATDMDEILSVAKRHKLFVIEDCAHALGATYPASAAPSLRSYPCSAKHVACGTRGKKAGTMGDMAFFSFGRDKVISSVYGGMLLINNANLLGEVKERYEALQYPDNQWIRQQLRHPLSMDVFLRWYNFPFSNYGAGKFCLQAAQVTHYLSKAVHWKEKQGLRPSYFPSRLPNALAYLALTQFKRLDEFNAHRRALAQLYYDELCSLKTKNLKLKTLQDGHIYLRYPVRHPRAHEIIRAARNRGILLGDWYTNAIAPDDTQLKAMHYQEGSCPVAEGLARETFNLPTNPSMSERDAHRVVEFLRTAL